MRVTGVLSIKLLLSLNFEDPTPEDVMRSAHEEAGSLAKPHFPPFQAMLPLSIPNFTHHEDTFCYSHRRCRVPGVHGISQETSVEGLRTIRTAEPRQWRPHTYFIKVIRHRWQPDGDRPAGGGRKPPLGAAVPARRPPRPAAKPPSGPAVRAGRRRPAPRARRRGSQRPPCFLAAGRQDVAAAAQHAAGAPGGDLAPALPLPRATPLESRHAS